jgi:hypothetical protein
MRLTSGSNRFIGRTPLEARLPDGLSCHLLRAAVGSASSVRLGKLHTVESQAGCQERRNPVPEWLTPGLPAFTCAGWDVYCQSP